MHPDQLAALDAIADTGTFEAAGRRLGVSTSALSQRIRALESSLGRILVRRGSPSTMTPDGEVVLRYARQQALLAGELSAELALAPTSPGDDGAAPPEPVRLTIAVNADSLATWFTGVLKRAAAWDAVLDLSVADEARTGELLRSGQVMCAVSSSGTRVAGCRSERLGAMRYMPVVARSLLEAHPEAVDSPGNLPAIRFDADDDLQDLALAAAGLPPSRPRASIPTAAGFIAGIRAGLGWGMALPEQIAEDPDLVRVPGLEPVERKLFWHRWAIRSAALDRLTQAVREAFAARG